MVRMSVDLVANGFRRVAGKRPPFILCYHGVGTPNGPDPSGLLISRRQFAEHLDITAERGYALVTVSELWRRIRRGEANGFGAVTFDDALAKTMGEALPELDARGMTCTMYVASGLLGGCHPDLPGERIMSPAQVVELARNGVEIGSHSVDHPRLTDHSYETALNQFVRSRTDLEQLIGRPVTSLAYPFGAHNGETVRAAADAGYETACGCDGIASWDAFSLPREPVFPSTTRLRLELKMAGLYAPVHRLAAARSMAATRSQMWSLTICTTYAVNVA